MLSYVSSCSSESDITVTLLILLYLCRPVIATGGLCMLLSKTQACFKAALVNILMNNNDRRTKLATIAGEANGATYFPQESAETTPELEDGKYWTCICWMARNTAPK